MHQVFEARPESIGHARHAVADHLRDAGCSLETIDEATLLTSEVTTNAVAHAVTVDFTVDVDVYRETVHIGVGDDDPHRPVSASPGIDAEGGRGLQIVERLATRWGVRRDRIGKTVWFELPFWLPTPA